MKAFRLYMIFSLLWHFTRGQDFPNLQFNFLTSKEGLSNNEVSHITQDKDGFIWISTMDGLNRFDGYRVRHFFHNPANENSLANNSIFKVIPDSLDRLWVSTVEGLSLFDKRTGSFRNFRHNPADSTSLDNDQFTRIYIDKKNRPWVSSLSSTFSLDSQFHFRKIETGIQNLKDGESKDINSYEGLMEDSQGRLWAYHFDHIFQIDKSTRRVVKSFGISKGNIVCFYQDADSKFWIGTFEGGLMQFDPDNGKISCVSLPNGANVVYSISDWWDQHHKRWLALAADIIFILVDPVTLQCKGYSFQQGYNSQPVIPKRVVRHVFVDQQNILWIATDAGVCYVVPSRQVYDLWPIPTTVADWVFSLCETRDGYWTVRWMGESLDFFDRNGHLSHVIDSIRVGGKKLPLVDSLKPYCVFNEGDSVLWFTTGIFLARIDISSKKVQLFKPPDGYNMTGLRSILPLDDHTWWIRTRNDGANGIYVFDPKRCQFTGHFVNKPGQPGSVPAQLLCIFQTSNHELYVTSRNQGLFKFDPETRQFHPLFRFQDKDLVRHSNNFGTLTEDRNGLLWIGSFAGVIAIDPSSGKLVVDYTGDEAIGGVEVSGVIFDQDQNAWLSTARGVFHILRSTGQVKALIPAEGGLDNVYGIFQEAQNHDIFCGIKGYLLHIMPFDLLKLQATKTAPVHFSEATVMDAPRYFQYTKTGQKELKLEPGQNRFSIDFSVLNYDGPNHYYYKLEGVMNDWQQNENGHLPFYNISAGTYTLVVRGSDSAGDSQDSVIINVQPHWWQTNLFMLFVLSVVVLVTVLLVRRRIVQIREEASIKQRMAEMEMIALRSQMNPHFIFNSLTSIENFMMQNEKRLASTYLNKFARLIRAILDSSRSETVPLSHELETLKLYVDLEQLRFNHQFTFTLEIDPRLVNEDTYVPALLLQPYVENAIVHGLAHSTKPERKIEVHILLKDNFINYLVNDNGIGRKLSALYNAQNKPNHQSVGLDISEERVQAFNSRHGAKGGVTITDLYHPDGTAAGTSVEIRLKFIKEHGVTQSHIG